MSEPTENDYPQFTVPRDVVGDMATKVGEKVSFEITGIDEDAVSMRCAKHGKKKEMDASEPVKRYHEKMMEQ